jgi:lysophospholipase L1-like esterase
MRRLPLALLALTLALAGCTAGSPAAEQQPGATVSAPLPFEELAYVALGDSYTAGPLVPRTDVAGGCFRSDRNYPALLADRLELDLTDVSCSGADTGDLVTWQRTVDDATVPPQLAALDEDTDLVTLGIGGNDFELFSRLVTTCPRLRAEDTDGNPCADELSRLGEDVAATTRRIGDNVAQAIGRIQDRAPDARVVLVGYLRIAPSQGACPRRLPFATGDLAFGDRVMRLLNAALAEAAERSGVEFVDMYAASAGHDVCSTRPWVNGRRTDTNRAAAYHPLASGMRAVARELEALLHPDSSAEGSQSPGG